MEAEFGQGKLSLVLMVTTKYNFDREEVTLLLTDQNVNQNIEEGEREIHKIQGGYQIAHARIYHDIEVQSGR